MVSPTKCCDWSGWVGRRLHYIVQGQDNFWAGSISSGPYYLQDVTELEVLWHPCPVFTPRSCQYALGWGFALQESLVRDIPGTGLRDIRLLTPLRCLGSQKRKRGLLGFCLLFQIKPFPYERHTPCSPNISRVSISGNAIISKLNPSVHLDPLAISQHFNIETLFIF